MHRRFSLVLLAFALIAIGCDSGGGSEFADSASISGSVTEDSGYAKAAAVEGAVVSATSVDANGDVTEHPDTAIVSAEGRYTIQIENPGAYVVLTAEGEGFSSAVVHFRNREVEASTAAPMNQESAAEADVFMSSRVNASAALRELAYPRIAAYVDARVAAALRSGGATARAIAEILVEGQESEDSYVENRDPDGEPDDRPIDDRRARDEEATLNLQAALDAAASVSERREALSDFAEIFATGYSAAGVSTVTSAEAMEAGYAAQVSAAADASVSADVVSALRMRADLFVGIATTVAVRASLVAGDATADALAAFDVASETFLAALAEAESTNDVALAYDAFGEVVDVQVAATLGLDVALVATARAATDTARTALEVAIDAAASGVAIAAAYQTYFTAAQAAASAALSASSKASIGAEVVALMSLH